MNYRDREKLKKAGYYDPDDPEDKETKEKLIIGGVLVFIFLAFILIYLPIKSCIEAPGMEERRRRQELEAKREAARWEEEESKQPHRKELIQRMLNQAVFQRIEYRSSGATVWVGSVFYNLSYHDKDIALGLIRAYAATRAKDKGYVLRLRDIRTGEQVGSVTEFGMTLR